MLNSPAFWGWAGSQAWRGGRSLVVCVGWSGEGCGSRRRRGELPVVPGASPIGSLLCSSPSVCIERACASRCAVSSAGDDVGAGEEGADFCAVEVTGDCLITFYGHDGVDMYRAVGDLSGTGHLGR